MSGSAQTLGRRLTASFGVCGCAAALGALPSCVYHPYGEEDPCTPEDRAIAVEFIRLTPSPRPIGPRPPESVQVVVTPPAYPFVETALLEARQNDLHCSDRSDIVEELRSTGARMGCDLVIIYAGNDETYSYSHRYGGGWHETRHGYRATCGVYYGSRPRSGPAPAATPTPAP